MSTCPLPASVEATQPNAVSEGYREDGIKVTWAVEPPHRAELISYLDGMGNPEPGFILVTDQDPKTTFEYIRALGLDEIQAYIWRVPGTIGTPENDLAFEKVVSLFVHHGGFTDMPCLIATSNSAKAWLNAKGLVESMPRPRGQIGRNLTSFQCPGILKPLLGV